MKKFFAAALVVSMLTVLLSGCMCQVADTTFQFDGSGTVEAKFGFSEEMVNAMNMRAEMTQNGFSFFRYDGHGYYGDQASESFANADEFNAIFAEVSAETAEVSKAATPGTVTLSVASDGGLTLTVQNTQTDRRSAIKTELAKQLPDYSDAQINALLEDMVMTYRFAFPAALVDYNAAAGITMKETLALVQELIKRDIQYIHVSEKEFFQNARRGADETRSRLDLIHEAIAGKTALIGLGNLFTGDDFDKVIGTGWVELAATGRSVMLNPDLARLVREGRDDLIDRFRDESKNDSYHLPKVLWPCVPDKDGPAKLP